ncbi:hypothetical protein PV11_08943 [Exophiala sideris]|uniref:SRR1-like domain-containing protein n=1 Tax=Exophiala sideris TaxID=1016849 RepID=A0A0D1VMA9_9EURO|nr:hypothetical protein PV11_08943 [Exophiala sideris]
MPHSSHKKKSLSKKRQEVLDEEGWTRITSSNTTSRAPAPNASTNGSESVFTWNFNGKQVTKTCGAAIRPMKPLQGTTLQSMQAHYTKVATKWLESEMYHSLKDVLTRRILASDSKIIKCVIFGSGSLCGDAIHWLDRHESAYYQIAAFKSVVDIIEQVQGQRPQSYAQEPYYNDLDTELLATLKSTAVTHPRGFELLDTNSFAYSPAAELEVEYQIMSLNPRIWLHRSLDHLHRNTGSTGDKFTIEESDTNLKMTEHFIANHESARLPDLPLKNFPFHGSVIWWPTEQQDPS